MSRPTKIKNPRLIKIMRELRSLEHAIEKINIIEELETEAIIDSTKRKLSTIEKEKINKINELEQDLRIKTVKRRMKEKPVSFKMKNKEIARRKIIELETEKKAKIIIKTRESKLEILREIIEKQVWRIECREKNLKKRNEKTNNRRK